MHLSKSSHEVLDANSRAAYDLFFDEYAAVVYGLINHTSYCEKQKEEIFAQAVQLLWSERCHIVAPDKLGNLAIIKAIAKIALTLRNVKDISISQFSNTKDKLQWAKDFIHHLVTKSAELGNQNKTA